MREWRTGTGSLSALCARSNTGELLEPAVVGGPIRSPANETRRVPEPAIAVKDGVLHLTRR
jgi:hypothetical protein